MPTHRTTRAARLAVVEDLRELLRQHGNGGTLIDTAPAETSGSGADATRVRGDPFAIVSTLSPGALGVISGEWSSGKTTLALREVARSTGLGERAAVIDGAGTLFPPALAAMGGALRRVLLVRPPPNRTIWAGEQVLRSGLFTLVVLLGLSRVDRTSLRRLQLAAERGGATGLVVPERPGTVAPGLTAARVVVRADAPRDEGARGAIAAPARRLRIEQEHLVREAGRRGRRAVS